MDDFRDEFHPLDPEDEVPNASEQFIDTPPHVSDSSAASASGWDKEQSASSKESPWYSSQSSKTDSSEQTMAGPSSTDTEKGGWYSPSEPNTFTRPFSDHTQGASSYTDFNSWNKHSQQSGWQSGGSSGGYNPFSQPGAEQYGHTQNEYRWNYNDYNHSNYTAEETDSQEFFGSEEMKSPKRKKRRGLAIAGTVLGGILAVGVFSLAGVGIYSLVNTNQPLLPSGTTSGTPSSGGDANYPGLTIETIPEGGTSDTTTTGEGLSTVEIAEKVKPSVVGIVQYQRSNTIAASGEGSGIIMSDDGYIVTNAHVVSGADGIKVVLENNEEYEASIIGIDTQTDIAVIKINADNLACASFGDSSQLKVGESVVAIGNPGGLEFAGSVTKGIVSALDRPIRSEVGYTMNCIQTDAAISPGNSGGPLVNSYGQVVGITSSKIAETDYEGIGFAIPIAQAKPVIDELIKNGRVTGRVKLGITIQEIDSVAADVYGMPSGILVISTEPDSDVANKGVVPGDIITEVNGQSVSSLADVRAIIDGDKPGDIIQLTVFRRTNGQADRTFQVDVALMEDDGSSSQSSSDSNSGGNYSEAYPDFQLPQKIS